MTDQLSPMEAIMWRVGQDATLRMTVGALIILDRPPTTEALSERLAFAADQAPRLRRRPDDPTAMRARPAWVDDPDPAPERHLRSLSVASPGSMRQVLDLVGLLESIPFDPERSPWDVTLIEGLEDGRAALYLRAHHVLTDGVGGIRLLGLLLDEPTWPRVERHAARRRGSGALSEPSANGDRSPGTFTITVDLPDAVRRFIDGVNAARDLRPTETAVRGVQRALDVANSVSRQLMVTGGPLSSRPASRSLLSRFEVISVEGARARLARPRRQPQRPPRGRRRRRPRALPRRARAAVRRAPPRHTDQPAPRPRGRRQLVRPGPPGGSDLGRAARAAVRCRRRAAGAGAAGAGAAGGVDASRRRSGACPTRLLLPALHAQADSVDFAATALPGLRGARHICGSLIEAIYPLGPRLGCPMNITAFGNDDRLDVGIALDPAALEQPDLLVECLTRRLRQLRHDARRAAPRPAGTDAVVPRGQRGRRRRQRRGLLDSLLDGATEIVQSVANEVAPGVVGALDVDEVVQRVDVQAIVDKVDIEAVVDRVDVEAIVDKVDVQAVVDKIDIEAVMDRVDLQALLARIDLNEVLDKLDVDLLLERMDINRVLARVDIDAVLAAGEPRRAGRPGRPAGRRRPPRHRSDRRQGGPQRGPPTGRHRRPRRADRGRRADGPLRVGGDGPDRRRGAQPGRRPRLVRAPLGRPRPAPRSVDGTDRPAAARHAAGGRRRDDQLPGLRPAAPASRALRRRGDALRLLRHRRARHRPAVLPRRRGRRVRAVGGAPRTGPTSPSPRSARGSRSSCGRSSTAPTRWPPPAARSAWPSSACGRCVPTAATSTRWHAIVRVLAFPLSFLLFGLGFVLILLRRDRRALHDLIASTAVVYAWDARAARLRFLLKQ